MRKYFYSRADSFLHGILINCDKDYTPLNLIQRELDVTTKINTIEQKELTWSGKELHGRYPYQLSQEHVDKVASHNWLKAGYLFGETEGFLMSIQDEVVPVRNYLKYIVKDVSLASDKCRRCGLASETIQHVTAGCKLLANSDYLARHNQVAGIIHQKLAQKYGLLDTNVPYYKYHPEAVLESDEARLYWDISIITDKEVRNNRPDIVLVKKNEKSAFIIDIAVPNSNNIRDTEHEKLRKYTDLAIEIKRLWKLQDIKIIPIIMSTIGITPKTLFSSLEHLELNTNIQWVIQKFVILKTCHIVRKHLGLNN